MLGQPETGREDAHVSERSPGKLVNLNVPKQGSHRLEKYLNIEGFLEKYLKIKSALKRIGKSLKGCSQILLFYVGLNTVDRELNQYKSAVPLFGLSCAAPNKGTTI